jgi:RNA polymerase sigma factor (sigma-70 family)
MPSGKEERMTPDRSAIATRQGFSDVFDRHFPEIYGYLARRVGAGLGEELAQETFTRALTGRETYDPDRQGIRPWLFGIASNILRRHARDQHRQFAAYSRVELEPAIPEHEAAIARADASAALPIMAEVLSGLDADQRDVLLLFAWGDLSYAEIAEALDTPIGTVRSRLSRARARMQSELAAHGISTTEEENVRL